MLLVFSHTLAYVLPSLFDSFRLEAQEVEIYIDGSLNAEETIFLFGKILSKRYLKRLEIICVPTIISSDAFLVDCTGLRENGCVTYIPSKKADRVLLDWKLLKKTPLKYGRLTITLMGIRMRKLTESKILKISATMLGQ